ncbi:hypothetical protein MLD38_038989 [Melastoma candidum]|uniref:Uncharacterized protein n=1 Tax=Melastoma candidum TaxID=119954 RepID=A0ACB9L1Z0_9MYRT|nr:hypothetical protein MLD38_038989 [Melastoma candidum]
MSRTFIAGRNDKRPRRALSTLYADIVPPGVNVLVVDINQACLAVTEAKLLRFGYYGNAGLAREKESNPSRFPGNLLNALVRMDQDVFVSSVIAVITARGVEEAASILEDKSNDVHLVLAEAYFPGMERFEALEKLVQKFDVAVVSESLCHVIG